MEIFYVFPLGVHNLVMGQETLIRNEIFPRTGRLRLPDRGRASSFAYCGLSQPENHWPLDSNDTVAQQQCLRHIADLLSDLLRNENPKAAFAEFGGKPPPIVFRSLPESGTPTDKEHFVIATISQSEIVVNTDAANKVLKFLSRVRLKNSAGVEVVLSDADKECYAARILFPSCAHEFKHLRIATRCKKEVNWFYKLPVLEQEGAGYGESLRTIRMFQRRFGPSDLLWKFIDSGPEEIRNSWREVIAVADKGEESFRKFCLKKAIATAPNSFENYSASQMESDYSKLKEKNPQPGEPWGLSLDSIIEFAKKKGNVEKLRTILVGEWNEELQLLRQEKAWFSPVKVAQSR